MSRPWAWSPVSRGSPEAVQTGAHNSGDGGNALMVAAGGRRIDSNSVTRDGTLSATDATIAFELRKSDETEAGTMRVRDILPGVGGSNPAEPTVTFFSLLAASRLQGSGADPEFLET